MITNQCGHTHVHVYLFETTCEDYSIENGEIVDTVTLLEPEPILQFDVYCKACNRLMKFDAEASDTPAWAMKLYDIAYKRSYGDV